VASGRAVDAGFAVVRNSDLAASGRAEDAELAVFVDSGAVASGRSDDADASVIRDADFPSDAVLVVGVDAALPLRAAVGRVVARKRRKLRRFVASSGRRRTGVLASRALG